MALVGIVSDCLSSVFDFVFKRSSHVLCVQ